MRLQSWSSASKVGKSQWAMTIRFDEPSLYGLSLRQQVLAVARLAFGRPFNADHLANTPVEHFVNECSCLGRWIR